MTIKCFKLWLYKKLARFSRWYFYSLFCVVLVAIVSAVLLKWGKEIPLIQKFILDIFVYAIFLMILLLPGILIWGWYFVWFRYAAYVGAWVISLIWRLFKNIFFQFFIILAASAYGWYWRKSLFLGSEYKPREMLILSSVIKILVITAAVFVFIQIIKSRKRIFIYNFENYTGDKQLDSAVKGIAPKILNEMNRLLKLLKTIDEIQPVSKKDLMAPTIDVQDMGKAFQDIIGQDSSVDIGNIKIPLRPIYTFFNKLLYGPILGGGIQLKGEKLMLTACLKGGKFDGSWEITIDDIEKPPTSKSEQVIAMTNQLVCRIVTHISKGGSPRWKAMHHYTEALRLYRDTLRTIEKKKLNLIKAKNECSRSLRDDSQFVRCYYNLGIIYNELESNDAAIAAFRKALESAPGNFPCYYQLGRIYYYDDNFFDAFWFCEQALTISPTESEHWNLWAVIKFREKYIIKKDDFKKKVKEIPEEAVQYFMIASALGWRALCKSLIRGEKITQIKESTRIFIRNLAKVTGMQKRWRSRCLFKQAMFLDPDNNDLHFELGKYYYRRNKIKKAYNAFKGVFEDDLEVDDPFLFWALYINVSAQLYDRTDNQKYKDIVNEGFFYFLDAASEIIQHKRILPESLEIYEMSISEALSIIKKKEEDLNSVGSLFKKKIVKNKGFLNELIILLDDLNSTICENADKSDDSKIYDYLKKWSGIFFHNGNDVSKYFNRWVEGQADIKYAIMNLEEMRKGTYKDSRNQEKMNDFLEKVINRLECSTVTLEKKNLKVLKRLGLKRILAEAYYQSENYIEALKIAREAVRLDPYNWEVRELLGRIYLNLSDYQKAVNEFEISARLEEHPPAELIEILKKIGKAYKKNGDLLQDPEQRKNSFNKAVGFFTDSLEILGDKSYEMTEEENDRKYMQSLKEIHFFLGTFYSELLRYDDAISHLKIALEMANILKMNKRKLQVLITIGWTYFECAEFTQAECTFKEAEQIFEELKQTYKVDSLEYNEKLAEIKIGIAFSQVERTLLIKKNNLSKEERPLKILKEVNACLLKVTNTDKKSRLSALYHECYGRLYMKQGELENAEQEFEKSLSSRTNPRVYNHIGILYWEKARESEDRWKNHYLVKTRSAFSFCLRNDLQQKYKNEVSRFLEDINLFEGQQTKPKT